MDNLVPHTHDNAAGGGVRRDMHGQIVNNWVPTWWGPNQLTYLPGVREYLREQAIRADKNSLDMNVLAHLGPQNLEEAWAYFKHWVKGRPVGHPKSACNRRHFTQATPNCRTAPGRSTCSTTRDCTRIDLTIRLLGCPHGPAVVEAEVVVGFGRVVHPVRHADRRQTTTTTTTIGLGLERWCLLP